MRYLSIGDNLSISGTTLNGTGDNNTTYSLPLGGNANAVSLNLTDSNGGVDSVAIVKGSGITFTNITSGGFTINADSQSGTTYDLGTRTTPSIRLAGSNSTTDDVTFVGHNGITLSSANNVNGGTINIFAAGVAGTRYDLFVPSGGTSIRLSGTTASGNNNDEVAAGSNPYDNDTDDDGLLDGNDAQPLISSDFDQDGIDDAYDNCYSVPNYNQENLDGDEFGDICDLDIDGDGFSNNIENKFGTDPLNNNSSAIRTAIDNYSSQVEPEKNVPMMGFLGLILMGSSILALVIFRKRL